MISKRFSDISSDKEHFDKAAPIYDEILKNSGLMKYHHKYYKLFNKNNVKISCSCMPNMKSFIQNHSAKLLSNHTTPVNVCMYVCMYLR